MSLHVVSVCKANPWLACSPDGIVMKNSLPERLLEIKCPVKEKLLTAGELVKTYKFLTCDGSSYALKKRHTYYTQVQPPLAILNVTMCDFIIFSSYDDTFVNISVPFDEEYAWGMLTRLKFIYFKHVLPVLPCEN